jgi:site-specific DNA-methyltransferase (adenine-specific)
MNISEWLEAGKPWNVILHGDCMDLMKHFNDKEIPLCITDPPYGNNLSGGRSANNGWNNKIDWNKCNNGWNLTIPTPEYFIELQRVSKNQIIWGGNYFANLLPPSECWLIWDKGQRNFSLADGEMAWTSFDKAMRIKTLHRAVANQETRIHPTQKPVALYRWLLQNYAKPGDKIIDTHSGSGSLACACHLEKFDFLAIEKDEDYYKSSCERLETLRSQGTLF